MPRPLTGGSWGSLALALLLCAGAQAASAEEGAYRVIAGSSQVELLSPDGRTLVNLLPVLLVSYSPPDKAPAINEVLPPPRRLNFTGVQVNRLPRGEWTVSASAVSWGGEYRLTFSGRPGDPRIRTTCEITATRNLLVHQEVLRYQSGPVTEAAMLDRAYRWQRADQKIFAGPLTPHLARLDRDGRGVSLRGGAGVQGLWLRPDTGGRVQIDLELDHQRNHPFRVLWGCGLKSGTHLPRLRLDETLRSAGRREVARFDWVMGGEFPAVVGRYPRGMRAAMVFADHADQSSAAKLEAFAFGRTGAIDAGELGPQFPGFVNRGLGYTKTVFLRRAGKYPPQLDDPAYRRLIDLLVERGVEIGVHSPSGVRDRPESSAALLGEFEQTYGGRTWIDHQPDTNCEAICNLGWRPQSRWYMLGILAATGFRFLANLEDAPLGPGSLNLLSPEWPATRRPILYPSPRLTTPEGESFIQFSSTWLFIRRERLLRWFSDRALDRLEAERGLLIGHVYFETFNPLERMSRQRLLESDGKGGLRLNPEVDALFARLDGRQSRGSLWVTGVEALCEHLLGSMAVEVEVAPEGILVRSGSARNLSGLTLLLPGERILALVDGKKPDSSRQTAEGLEVWFDLPAGEARRLTLLDQQGKPLAAVPPVEVLLEQERP